MVISRRFAQSQSTIAVLSFQIICTCYCSTMSFFQDYLLASLIIVLSEALIGLLRVFAHSNSLMMPSGLVARCQVFCQCSTVGCNTLFVSSQGHGACQQMRHCCHHLHQFQHSHTGMWSHLLWKEGVVLNTIAKNSLIVHHIILLLLGNTAVCCNIAFICCKKCGPLELFHQFLSTNVVFWSPFINFYPPTNLIGSAYWLCVFLGHVL